MFFSSFFLVIQYINCKYCYTVHHNQVMLQLQHHYCRTSKVALKFICILIPTSRRCCVLQQPPGDICERGGAHNASGLIVVTLQHITALRFKQLIKVSAQRQLCIIHTQFWKRSECALLPTSWSEQMATQVNVIKKNM